MRLFVKAVCLVLAIFLIKLPVYAVGEGGGALGLYSLSAPEQFSFFRHELIDDFEQGVDAWSAYDGSSVSQTENSACGEYGMLISGVDRIGAVTEFDAFRASSAKSIMLACKASGDGVLTVSDGEGYSASGSVVGGEWYTASVDIRQRDDDKLGSVDISLSSSGECELYVDYVCTSNVPTIATETRFLTDEYTSERATLTVDDIMTVTTSGRTCSIETGRIDTLITDDNNAVILTADNGANCSKINMYYADEGQDYSSGRCIEAEMQSGVGTYVFPLDGEESVCRIKFEFEGEPEGVITVYNIAFSCSISNGIRAECFVGENGKITFKGGNSENGACYLFRTLPNGSYDPSTPFMVNDDGSGEFVFDAFDNGEHGAMYKYASVYYDGEGEAVTICPPTGVDGVSALAKKDAYIPLKTEKCVIGASFDASASFLKVNAESALVSEETAYYYEYCEEKYYVSEKLVNELDGEISRLNAHEIAVYVQYEWFEYIAGVYDEASARRLYALTAFLTERYSTDGMIVNGIVAGEGGNTSDKPISSASLRCEAALYTINAAMKSVNGSAELIFPVRAGARTDHIKMLNTVMQACEYVDGVMLVTERGEGLYEFCKYATLRGEFDAYVSSFGYSAEEYAKAAVDFYESVLLSVKAFALDSETAANMGEAFVALDTPFANDVFPELSSLDGYDEERYAHMRVEDGTLTVSYGSIRPELDGVDGKWLCGNNCTSSQIKGDGCSELLFSTGEGNTGFGVFVPNKAVITNGDGLNVHLRADYLGQRSAEVILYAACEDKTVQARAVFDGERDVVLTLDTDKTDVIERLYLGIKGSRTPRLTVYGIYVGDNAVSEETSGVQTSSNETNAQTSDDNNITDGEKKESSSPFAAVTVTVIAILCIGAAFVVLDQRREGSVIKRIVHRIKK